MATTLALRPSVEVPATAVALPASVIVHTTAPPELTVGALKDAVNPFGNPEATVMLDPAPPAATVIPPTGVAVTVTVEDDRDCIETDAGDEASVIPGAACTCKLTLFVAVSPSPAAVIVTVAEATGAVLDAKSANVSEYEAAAEAVVNGFADHIAVTPAGKPLTENVMLPVNDPPVAVVRLTAAELPAATTTAVDPAVSVRVGGWVTVSA